MKFMEEKLEEAIIEQAKIHDLLLSKLISSELQIQNPECSLGDA